jgi:hypothetical protein
MNTLSESIEVLKKEVCEFYGRTRLHLTHLEEFHLVQILKDNPDWPDEWIEIKTYRNRTQFFPRSVSSLLEKWQQTLDASRIDAKPKRDSHIPTQKEVMDYAREKWPDETWQNWGVSFFGFWSRRNWIKNNIPLDWKTELVNQCSKWRTVKL